MPSLTFDQLIDVYKHTRFDADGRGGKLYIASDKILSSLRLIDADDGASADSGISVARNPNDLAVREEVRIELSAPRLALGILALNFDQLLHAPEARIREPAAYFVIDGKIYSNQPHLPKRVGVYRSVISLVNLFAEAAAFLDKLRQELVFVRDRKFVVPVRYDAAVLDRVSLDAAVRLQAAFEGNTHKDQKLEILADALIQICEAQPIEKRFSFLLENLDALADAVRDGYKLFASSFSYAKIRSELENAKIDYVAKIHKTFVDIQGQLLGIPIATVVVASQLKVASSCGLELWANIALVCGAWVFFILLSIAIINQWLTLNSIAFEISRQKTKLAQDYIAISDRFAEIFDSLSWRIFWQKVILVVVGVIAVGSSLFATVAFNRVVHVDVLACVLEAI